MDLASKTTEQLLALKKQYQSIVSVKNSEQMAFKILLNSVFGAIGNPGFRYFNKEMARSITMSGQCTILWSERIANEFLNNFFKTKGISYCLYVDTDSLYLDLDILYQKIRSKNQDAPLSGIVDVAHKLCLKIQDTIQESYKTLYERLNGTNNRLFMNRENIGAALFYQKKRYIMQVYDEEGIRYDPYKAKVMGMEAIRSTTPEWARNKLKETYMKMFELNKDDMIDYVDTLRKEFHQLHYHQIASNSGVSDIDKFVLNDKSYRVGTPYHVKAALHFNMLLDKLGIADKYEYIKNGDKIKLLNLITPNPTGNKVIGYIDYLPPEFELEPYIDTSTQFYKVYEKPISAIFEVIGYQTEKTNTQGDFY